MPPEFAVAVPAFHRAHDYAGLWAIEETRGRALAALAARTDLAAHVARAEPPRLRSAITSVPVSGGKSVAVIRVAGTLMKGESSLTASTSTVQLRRDVRKAAADPEVLAILLAIDSPGGTVAGTADLAAEVKAAAKKKPVWAHADDLCASAAYWVASQCERVFANDATALVGSIGTVLTLYDASAAAEREGVKPLVFATGPLKGAGTPGAAVTADQVAYFQAMVDETQKSFDRAVRLGRGLTEKQLADVRTGGVFAAPEAEAKRLIDGVKSFDATLQLLAAEARQKTPRPAGSAAAPLTPTARAEAPMDETLLVTAPTPTPAAGGTPAVTAEVAPDLTRTRAEFAAELRRVAAVQAACKGHPDIAADAVEKGWTVERAELEVLRRAGRAAAAAGAPLVPARPAADAQVLEAALCLAGGVRPAAVAGHLAAADRERVMNEALSARFRGFGLHALMDATIHAAGGHFVGSRKSNDFIREAIAADRTLRAAGGMQAGAGGFSTVSLSGILGNVANKALIEAYTAVEVVWNMIAAVRSHSDFKANTRYRLDSTGAFKKVGQDGELKHVGLSEAGYTNQLSTYGAVIALTRQMMINDDLGAFLDLPKLMGRMGALRIEEAVFVLLLSNPSSFFAAGNRNLTTGAGGAFSLASLTTLEQKFRDQVDSNAKPILVSPQLVLVPTPLKVDADTIFAEKLLITGENATKTARNPHAGKFKPVTSPYLNNTNVKDQDGAAITGQSATAWYMFADPNVRAAVAVAFLNGQQTPTIESADTAFDTLGMQWRAFNDFGVGMEDPAAAQKANGA